MGHFLGIGYKVGCKNGTQLAYHPAVMRTLLTLSAFAGLACGVRHFLNFMNLKKKTRLQEKKLEVWEGEGGAVPAAKTRTAAQIRPRKRPAASPRGVT
jgi:hypothetical protein